MWSDCGRDPNSKRMNTCDIRSLVSERTREHYKDPPSANKASNNTITLQ